MSALRAILGLSPNGSPCNDPDSADLRARIDEEFAHHLDERAREIERAEGVPPKTARELARARFGDPHKLARQCERIATWEKTMLQRINAALSVLLLIGLVSVGWLAWTQNRATSETLAEVGASIEQLREQLGSTETETPQERYPNEFALETGRYTVQVGDTLPSIAVALYGDESMWNDIAEFNHSRIHDSGGIKPGLILALPANSTLGTQPGTAFVTGDVINPGAYTISQGGLTLEQAILAAGGTNDEAPRGTGPLIMLTRDENGQRSKIYEDLYAVLQSSGDSIQLRNDDRITVANNFLGRMSSAEVLGPTERTITVHGAVERPGTWNLLSSRMTTLAQALGEAGFYIVKGEIVDVDVVGETGTREFSIAGPYGNVAYPPALVHAGEEIRVYEHGREYGIEDVISSAVQITLEGVPSDTSNWYHIEDSTSLLDAIALAAGGSKYPPADAEGPVMVSLSKSTFVNESGSGWSIYKSEWMGRLSGEQLHSWAAGYPVASRDRVEVSVRELHYGPDYEFSPVDRQRWLPEDVITLIVRTKEKPEKEWQIHPPNGDNQIELGSLHMFLIGGSPVRNREQQITLQPASGESQRDAIDPQRRKHSLTDLDLPQTIFPGDTIIFEEL